MWSFDIEHRLSSDPTFIGCYPHDTLPKLRKRQICSVIINTGDSGTLGKHWVAVKMTKDNCFYFDSFGLGIVNENIMTFVSNYKKAIYSDICIQDIRSKKFGEFCIAFLENVNSTDHYDSFINIFSDCDLYMNDFIVNDIMK